MQGNLASFENRLKKKNTHTTLWEQNVSFKVNGNISVVVSIILFLVEICSDQFIFWKPDYIFLTHSFFKLV